MFDRDGLTPKICVGVSWQSNDALGRRVYGETMSKNPKMEHEYHAGKDELKICVRGYALKSKKTRDKVMKTLCDEVERSPTA